MTKEELEIQRIKKKLMGVGLFLPGSIREQWNVCGKKDCRCKDPEEPIKHGPYHQLSFSVAGKSSTMFIKKEDLSEARRRVKRYQIYKKLCADLTKAQIDLVRKNGFGG